MDKRRRHRNLWHLSEIQNLQLAQAKLGLTDKQILVRQAGEQHLVCSNRRDMAELALRSLLDAATFCPNSFQIACEVLLMDEADVAKSNRCLHEANVQESEQRAIWHRNRLQAEWLNEQKTKLGRKLLQTREDKLLRETAAVRRTVRKG